MKRAVAFALCAFCLFLPAVVFGQDKTSPLPLSDFIALFTDESATSAQKEVGLPKGKYYRGVVTVSDVQLYTVKDKGKKVAEITDRNIDAGCYILLLRIDDVDKALTLKKGDKLIVTGMLSEIGLHVDRFVIDCETYFALFRDVEIVEVMK